MSAKQLLHKLEGDTATDADVLSALRAFSDECLWWGEIVSQFDGHIQVAVGEHDRLDCVSMALQSVLYAAGVVERLLPPEFAEEASGTPEF